MSSPLPLAIEWSELFRWWQLPLLLVLIALIVFLIWYRRRQY